MLSKLIILEKLTVLGCGFRVACLILNFNFKIEIDFWNWYWKQLSLLKNYNYGFNGNDGKIERYPKQNWGN